MSKFGTISAPGDIPALPLWIDGHAYLMMAEQFIDVHDATGRALRRVPLYGADAVAIASASTRAAIDVWHGMTPEARAQCFHGLHALLVRFQAHLTGLLVEESGAVEEAGSVQERAERELAAALVSAGGLGQATMAPGAGVAGVMCDALAPFAAPLNCAIDALLAGWGVILKPSPKTPSALFATAELFTRAGFPPGLVNCVPGDEAVARALCADGVMGALAFCGDTALAETLGGWAGAAGTPFAHAATVSGGTPGKTLHDAWRDCLGVKP